jgi:hypothetical protein
VLHSSCAPLAASTAIHHFAGERRAKSIAKINPISIAIPALHSRA